MIININRVNRKNVGVYEELLEENNFKLKKIKSAGISEWVVKICELNELFRLAKVLGHELVINGKLQNSILIYDGEIE